MSRPEPPRLTRREAQLLVRMANGRTNRQIGQELFISENTVKTQAKSLLRRLGAIDRTHAVGLGIGYGLLTAAHIRLPQKDGDQ